MKLDLMKSPFKHYLLLASLLISSISLLGQEQRLKTIEKDFNGVNELKVLHRHGPLEVKTSTDNKIYAVATISVKAKKEEDFQKVFRHFEVSAAQEGDKLILKTEFETKNWNSNNGRMSIRFQDGEKVKNIRDLEISFSVFVPNLKTLMLENKYDEINIDQSIQSEYVSVKLYSGRLRVGEVKGDLKVDMKYSKAKVGGFGKGRFDLYESDVEAGQGNELMIKSKYGNLNFGTVAKNVDIDSYEDKIKITEMGGDMRIKSKYTTFELGNFKNGMFDLYESNITGKKAGDIQLKSKYGKFRFESLGRIDFESSYEDDLEVGNAKSLIANSKYGEFTFSKLSGKVNLKSYEDKLRVSEFVGPFEGVNIDGKYTVADLNMASGVAYQVDIDMKYGKLEYDEAKFEVNYYKEKGDNLQVKGKTNGASSDAPNIMVKGYECKVRL